MWWEALTTTCDAIPLFNSSLLERYFRLCEEFVSPLNAN